MLTPYGIVNGISLKYSLKPLKLLEEIKSKMHFSDIQKQLFYKKKMVWTVLFIRLQGYTK